MRKTGDKQSYYWVFGQRLGTWETLGGRLPYATPPADVEYVVARDHDSIICRKTGSSSTDFGLCLDDSTQSSGWHGVEKYSIDFTGVGTCDLGPKSISCYPDPDVSEETLNNVLLGDLLSLWLELKGIPVLHASAVVNSGVVGLLSHGGNGKSTLAAALVQSGHPLFTDDILAVGLNGDTCMGYPGYPWMRLWPEEANFFVGNSEALERVDPEISKRWVPVGENGFGTFCGEPQPLTCLYIPERLNSESVNPEIDISGVSPRDAVIELMRYSFGALSLDALGLQKQRIDLLARIAQQVPLRRLVYPSGFEHLPRVCDAILQDLASLRMH